MQDYLFEFTWRRQNEQDLWRGLMRGLSLVRYTPAELSSVLEERTEVGNDAIDAADESFQPLEVTKSDSSLSADSFGSEHTSDNSTADYIGRCASNEETLKKKSI